MFFWFGFPFFFFIPFMLVFFALRAGSNLLRSRPGGFFQYQNNPFFPNQEGGLQAKVFQLAYRLKGRITVSDIVVETGLSVQEAEKLVEGMVDNSRVRMEVNDNGLVTYEFPEIISRFESA